ncbi:hypothetical protein FB45DRAFT_1056009 [Roridomyces roridus]|uniref:Uncharacterized protein n=1 Tax=Roridomyces roridus TaxID=1738132 RepID=A0AAD7FQ64_9AGAR|nr:hypothetical protein FB45DRAFT_1056009 [Roridomyces roridus]
MPWKLLAIPHLHIHSGWTKMRRLSSLTLGLSPYRTGTISLAVPGLIVKGGACRSQSRIFSPLKSHRLRFGSESTAGFRQILVDFKKGRRREGTPSFLGQGSRADRLFISTRPLRLHPLSHLLHPDFAALASSAVILLAAGVLLSTSWLVSITGIVASPPPAHRLSIHG